MGLVPWELLESGLLDDAELGDPRRLAEVRSVLDPYQVLGVGPDASTEAVRAAYRRLAREHHPDRGGDKELFQQISAAHDALVGVGADAGSVLPYGGSQCPSKSPANAARKDVVRCILVAPGWGWLTLDEKEVVVLTAQERWVAVRPQEATLLCCCFLDNHKRLAVGGTKGTLLTVNLQCARGSELPEPIILETGVRGPVMAVCAPPGDQSSFLFASIDGSVLVLDVDAGCVLCSLSDRMGELQAEALLCPIVPEVRPRLHTCGCHRDANVTRNPSLSSGTACYLAACSPFETAVFTAPAPRSLTARRR